MHHLLGALLTPLLPFIRDDFLLDYTQAGWLLSAYSWSYGVSQIPAGYLSDKIGLRLIMTIGISGVALVGIIIGVSPSYYMMAIFLVLLGLLGGGYHPASAPIISELVEPEKRGLVLGIHQVGGTCSFFLTPLIAVGIASYFGWRGSFIGLALIALVFGIIFYILLRRSGRDTKAVRTQAESHIATPSPKNHTHHLIIFLILGIASYAVILSAVSFLPLFTVDYLNGSEEIGAALLSIVHFAGLLAGPLGGYLSDRFGMVKVMVITVLIAGPLLYLLSMASYGWAIYVLSFAIGMSMYIVMPVVESYIIGYVSEQRRSRFLGIYYFGSRGGSGAIMPVIGYFIDKFGFGTSFTIVGAFLTAVTLGCMGLLLRKRE
jgi:FSR family fosmidomycin resistance protein-like MFS transporter